VLFRARWGLPGHRGARRPKDRRSQGLVRSQGRHSVPTSADL